MTEHVIECRWESHRCICEELRACEQRVKQSITALSWYSKARWTGYYEGIDAAEAAVLDQAVRNLGCCACNTDLESSLAAIRALKENDETEHLS